MMNKLQVLVATFGQEGLDRFASMSLPEVEGVSYLVGCQTPESFPTVPNQLKRRDVEIRFYFDRGLSRNRNHLLKEATAPYCLIADDDLSFSPDGLREIINLFERDSTLSIIALKYTDHNGKTEKPYPDTPFPLTQPPKGFFITSFELAFRRESVIESKIVFNENFGIGSERYACGEEDIWLRQLLAYGLRGKFFPITIAIHNGPTTGLRMPSHPSVLRAQGVVISYTYPKSALPRVLLKAWRSSRMSNTDFFHCLIPLLGGWKDYLLHKNRLLYNNHALE